MAGADENSAKDASAVIAALDYLRADDGQRDARDPPHRHRRDARAGEHRVPGCGGRAALLSKNRRTAHVEVRQSARRPAAHADPFPAGAVADSMVLAEADPRADASRPLGRGAIAVLHSLQAIATAEGGTCTEWKESSGVSHVSFYRARKLLLARGLVVQTKGKYRTAPGVVVP